MKLPPHQNPDYRPVCYIIMSLRDKDFKASLEGPALVVSGSKFFNDFYMDKVMKEAPISRDVLEEIEKDGVHYFKGIMDISREFNRRGPAAGLILIAS